jgi:hypothetical protein
MIITFWPLGVGLECNSIMVPPRVACIDWNIASLNCLPYHLAWDGWEGWESGYLQPPASLENRIDELPALILV